MWTYNPLKEWSRLQKSQSVATHTKSTRRIHETETVRISNIDFDIAILGNLQK